MENLARHLFGLLLIAGLALGLWLCQVGYNRAGDILGGVCVATLLVLCASDGREED